MTQVIGRRAISKMEGSHEALAERRCARRYRYRGIGPRQGARDATHPLRLLQPTPSMEIPTG